MFKQQFKYSMKIKLQKSRLKLIVLGIVATTLVAGCSKEKMVTPTPAQNVEDPNNVSVDVLRTYYANLIQADVKYVTYDEKADQFLLLGVAQMNKKKLTEMYLLNTNPPIIL
jgi:hypothetical protein